MKQLIYYYSGAKMTFYGRDESELTENLVNYLSNKGSEFDIDTIKRAVKSGIHESPKRKIASSFKVKGRGKKITAKSALKTSAAMIKCMTSPVDQATFDARQRICSSCALYQTTSDCHG